MSFVVYDLEYTSWEGSWERGWTRPGEHRELVQIGAVRLDADYAEEAALALLIRPTVNPDLSDYFCRLTGITAGQVAEHGLDLATALALLSDFAGPLPLWANGCDGEILAANCRLVGIANPLAGRCHSIRPAFAAALGPDRRSHLWPSAPDPGLPQLRPHPRRPRRRPRHRRGDAAAGIVRGGRRRLAPLVSQR